MIKLNSIRLVIFILTWIPYAIEAFYSSLFNSPAKEPLFSVIPTIFAKSSMLWPSLFYLLTNNIINKRRRMEHKADLDRKIKEINCNATTDLIS